MYSATNTGKQIIMVYYPRSSEGLLCSKRGAWQAQQHDTQASNEGQSFLQETTGTPQQRWHCCSHVGFESWVVSIGAFISRKRKDKTSLTRSLATETAVASFLASPSSCIRVLTRSAGWMNTQADMPLAPATMKLA